MFSHTELNIGADFLILRQLPTVAVFKLYSGAVIKLNIGAVFKLYSCGNSKRLLFVKPLLQTQFTHKYKKTDCILHY